MSFLGQDDGNLGLGHARALGDVKVAEARQAGNGIRQLGWWPQAGTVAKFILVILGVIVLIGWLLTALNH